MSQPLLAGGEFALVKKHLESIASKPFIRRGMPVTDSVSYYMYTDLAVLERNESDLRHYAPLALETAKRDDHKLYQASAQRALGVLYRLTGDYVAAEDHLHQALQGFEGLETRWQIGRTLAELGELAAVQQDYVQVRDYYAHAIEAFDAMGAVPDLERARAALKALDETS